MKVEISAVSTPTMVTPVSTITEQVKYTHILRATAKVPNSSTPTCKVRFYVNVGKLRFCATSSFHRLSQGQIEIPIIWRNGMKTPELLVANEYSVDDIVVKDVQVLPLTVHTHYQGMSIIENIPC